MPIWPYIISLEIDDTAEAICCVPCLHLPAQMPPLVWVCVGQAEVKAVVDQEIGQEIARLEAKIDAVISRLLFIGK